MKETEHPVRAQRINWRSLVLAAVMALLAPLLADTLHSCIVVSSGIRFYNAEIGRMGAALFWDYVAPRAAITFLIIWFFARTRFRDIWVWCCAVALWTFLDIQMEVAIK